MAIIRQIKTGTNAGLWGYVTRGGAKNSRILPLNGLDISVLIKETDLGDTYQVPGSQIQNLKISSGPFVGQEAGKFYRFPVTIRGAVTTAAPNGDYTITSETATPLPLGNRGNYNAPSTRSVPPTVPTGVPAGTVVPPPQPGFPFGGSPISSASAGPAPAAPAGRRTPRTGTGGLSDNELRVADGTPAITVQKMGMFLDVLPANRSVMFWGPPGCGKSMGISSWCKAKNKKLFDVRLPLLDPIDLRGIGVPDLVNNICRWLPAEFIPKEPNCVLFLDEISAAAPAVQVAAYQLTLDRKIGETELPPDCRVVAAGNRESDRGVAYRMPSPLANRFMHFTIETKIGDWRSWAFREGIDGRIISYLMLHPDMLHKMDEGASGQAWPSPRSWQFASEALSTTLPESFMGVAVASCVGVKAAKDFIKHTKDFERLSRMIPVILSGGPATTSKESDPSKCQTMACSLICNCPEDEQLMNNAVRWALCQNGEWTALTVKGLEEKFGVDAMNDLPAYQEYLNPGGVPNPTGASRVRTGARPPSGF